VTLTRNQWIAAAALAGGAVLVLSQVLPRSVLCKPLIQGAGKRVLLVGDSLAVGLNKPFSTGAQARGFSSQVHAKISTTMSHWLGSGNLPGIVAAFRPDLVLICLGTNDSKANFKDAQLADYIQRILATSSSGGAKVGWILPPKLPFVDRVGPIVRATGTPSFESSGLDIPQMDKIHPSGAGSAMWSDAIWRWATCST